MVIWCLSYEPSVSLHVQTQHLWLVVPDADSHVTCSTWYGFSPWLAVLMQIFAWLVVGLKKSVLSVCLSVSLFGEKFWNQDIYYVKGLLYAAVTWQSKKNNVCVRLFITCVQMQGFPIDSHTLMWVRRMIIYSYCIVFVVIVLSYCFA